MSKGKREAKRKPANCLLAEWKRNPTLFDKEKLSLVGLEIHIIDAIPATLAASVKVLYLSDNRICRLAGMEQFMNTATLSIKNNAIRYLDEIQPLSRLRRLTKLSMEGNPVTRLPYYREHVIVSCPALTVLDDRAVSADERATASREFFRNTAYYDQLRINELRNCVISHIRNMLACHLELHQTVFGKFSHLLSEHIGQSSVPQSCVAAGLGRVLQQALDGGVFCWLQRMDIKHFNHLVQLLAHFVQQGQGQGHNSTNSKAELWSILLESYLKEQCSVFMEAQEQCAELRRMAKGRYSSNSNNDYGQHSQHMQVLEESHEYDAVMCCVDRVQFLSSPCPYACSCVTIARNKRVGAAGGAGAPHSTAGSSGQGSTVQGGVGRDLMGRPSTAATLLLPPVSGAPESQVQHNYRRDDINRRNSAGGGWMEAARSGHRSASPPPPPPPPPPMSPPAHTTYMHRAEQSAERTGSGYENNNNNNRTYGMTNGVVRQSSADTESTYATEEQQILRARERNNDRYNELLRTTLHNPPVPVNVNSQPLPPKEGSRGQHTSLSAHCVDNAPRPTAAVRTPTSLSSTLLPPQQTDPNPQNEDSARDGASINVESSGDGEDNLGPDWEASAYAQSTARFQGEVQEFLRRALHSTLALSAAPTAGDGTDRAAAAMLLEEDPLLDLSFSQEMESRWLLAAQSINAYLTSGEQAVQLADSRHQRVEWSNTNHSPVGAAPVAEVTSIAALKAQISAQNNKYLLSQRAEFNLHGLNRALWEAVERFSEQTLALAKTAERQFLLGRKEIEGVREDTVFGSACLKGHRTALASAEGVQESIQELLVEKDALVAAEREVQLSLAAAREKHTELAARIGNVKAMVTGLHSDASVITLIRFVQLSNKARAFWLASRGSAALKGRIFRLLRQQVRRQVRIRAFTSSLRRKISGRVRALAFAAWKTFIAVLKTGRRLRKRKDRLIRASVLQLWRSAHNRVARRLPVATATLRLRSLGKAFAALVDVSRAHRAAVGVSERHSMYVALFTSVRIFRAWKRLAQSSRREQQRLVDVIKQEAQLRTLSVWAEQARHRRDAREQYVATIATRYERSRIHRCLHVWSSLLQYRNQLCAMRRMKRLFGRFCNRLLSQRRQKACQRMAGVVAASGEGLLRGALIRTVRHWRSTVVRWKRMRMAAHRVSSATKAVVMQEAWGTWRGLSQRFRSLSRHMVLVARRAQVYSLHRHFSVWVQATPKLPSPAVTLSQREVHTIREQWLNLFDSAGAGFDSQVSTTRMDQHKPLEQRQHDRHGTRLSARRGNRLKDSMSTVDFQLLYLDDDDEDVSHGEQVAEEEEGDGDGDGGTRSHSEGITVRDFSILARRYWVRWVRRSARRASLCRRHARVCSFTAAATCKSVLAVMRKVLFNRMLSRKNTYQAHLEAPAELQLNQPDLQTRRAEIEVGVSADQRRHADLRQLADNVTLALATSRAEAEAQQGVLADVDSSMQALAAEKAVLQGRIQSARAYIASVQQRRDQYLTCGWTGDNSPSSESPSLIPSALPDLLARLSAPSGFGSGSSVGDEQRDDSYSVSLTVQTDSSGAADERMLLMQDVEALYREAVAAQERMLTKQQHLANRREAAEILLAQRREQEQLLDEQISALLEERAGAEEALRRCTDALQDAFRKITEQTQYHEEVLTALQKEEGELRERLQQLVQIEHRLVSRVEALQDHYQQQDLHSVSHLEQRYAPLGMAEREARAVQHLSVSISAASRSKATAAGQATERDCASRTAANSTPALYPRHTTSGAAAGVGAAASTTVLKRGTKAPKVDEPDNGPHKHKSRQLPDQKMAMARGRKLEGKENEHIATTATRTSALPASTRKSRPGTTDTPSGDVIGREIDALSQRIRQRLTAI